MENLNKGNNMYKPATMADMGTAFILYQTVLEILSDEARDRLEIEAKEKFKKFSPQAASIDAAMTASAAAVEANCEKFCSLALDGIFEMLEELFPVENTPENVPE
jgi:hypothetical protein